MRRTILMSGACLVVTFGFAIESAAQSTWYVDDNCVPPGNGSSAAPFCTIQEAIDAVYNQAEDTIIVRDGTYTGVGNRDISFAGKPITVRSENGAGTCIIDLQGAPGNNHGGFNFNNGETSAARLIGVTVQNGNGYGYGAATIFDASPTISDCVSRIIITPETAARFILRGSARRRLSAASYRGIMPWARAAVFSPTGAVAERRRA